MAEIIIDNWQRGMSDNPLTDFYEMREIDVESEPGVAKVNYRTTNDQAGFIPNYPIWFAQDSSGTAVAFMGVNNSNNTYVYRSGAWATATTTAASGGVNGIVWKNHLFSFNNTKINVYGELTGAATWSTSWKTVDGDSTDVYPAAVGQDDILYAGCGRYVTSIQENAGQTFQQGTAATYTFQQRALDLPAGYRIRTLAELGDKLILGTWKSSSGRLDARIYPWDRSSASTGLPIILEEDGIRAGIAVDNLYYFFAGTKGNFYVTDGTSVKKLFTLPAYLLETVTNSSFAIDPNGISYYQGKILFAPVGGGSTVNNTYAQVWSYNISTGTLKIENETLAGFSDGRSVTALAVFDANGGNTTYKMGFISASGIKGVNSSNHSTYLGTRETSYQALIDTIYYSLGTARKPAALKEVDFELIAPLSTGLGVRFSYRTDISASYTVLRTFDFATDGAIQGGIADFGGITAQGVQLRIELTTNYETGAFNTPKLKKVVLRYV